MQKQFQRQTAYKVWISDLIKCEMFREEGEFGINYILIKNNKMNRVNILGFVVEKYYNEENHISFVLDDKSGRIKLKVWNDDVNVFNKIDIGDFVLVIGKIKSGNERYIAPEIIKRLDNPLWGRLRQEELTRIYGKPVRQDSYVEVKEEKVVEPTESIRQNILAVIEKNDRGIGLRFEEILAFVNCDEAYLNDIVDTLIKEGEVFNLEGRFKLVG